MELDIKTVTGGPLDVNTYVVGADGSNQCVLIDPGAEYAAVCGAVCSRQVTAVLLTHAHFDHMLYARPWLKDGVKLYVHKLDAAALADPSLNLSGVIGAQLTLPEAVWGKLSLSWIAFFSFMGVLNLIIAFNFPTDTWVNFKLFGGMGLLLVFVLAQGMLLSKYVEDKS